MGKVKNLAFLTFMLLMSVNSINTVQAQELPANGNEGSFSRNTTNGAYYWFAMGSYHYIESPSTLTGLFNQNDNELFNFTTFSPSARVGGNLGPNNGLIRDTNDGKIYFLRDGRIHHLTTDAIIAQYHFRTKSIRNVTGISGYILCSPFPMIDYINLTCNW